MFCAQIYGLNLLTRHQNHLRLKRERQELLHDPDLERASISQEVTSVHLQPIADRQAATRHVQRQPERGKVER